MPRALFTQRSVPAYGVQKPIISYQPIQTEKEEEEFLTCAQTQGIRLSPLSAHYHNRETERKNVYVMNYSSVQMEDAQEIVRRLERCV